MTRVFFTGSAAALLLLAGTAGAWAQPAPESATAATPELRPGGAAGNPASPNLGEALAKALTELGASRDTGAPAPAQEADAH